MRRTRWLVPAVLFLAVVGADTGVWYLTVRAMRTGLHEWVVARRAAGWKISAVSPQAGGWPMEATLILRDFEISGGTADIPGGLSWRADRVTLRLTPRDLHHLQVQTRGVQHLRLSEAPAIAYGASLLELLVPLGSTPAEQVLDLTGEGLRAHVAAGTVTDLTTIDKLEAHLVVRPAAGRGQAVAALTAAAEDITLPEHVHWALGQRVRSLAVDGAINGPLPNAASLTARAGEWRDAGGSADVRRVALHWGALDLTAHGTLSLDAQLQPAGTATAEVSGYAPTLDVLAKHGAISDSAAVTAKAMLSLIAATPASGGPSQVEVPLSLKQGTLTMHDVPLLRLPHLDWPSS